ncbi:hypothetical protein [Novosphingobium taihuense]|uniref:Uncharacterized protein n=1 Tax=Novosphingobium taihuense TaxID=260085 RepID=A0A7W7A917_9SPHN|nr:hypothetical protein [Novosphingobium taihuense]MBB4612566.1 hypothetical protein [Novosphingobium taihuense]
MASSDLQLSLESRLCLSCGLCCDGTLYEDAKIRDDEVASVEGIGLKTGRNAEGHATFLFACHYLDGACCTRYDQWRPSVCGKYFCRLQEKVRRNELAEDQAFDKIATARRLAADVKKALPTGMPIFEARHHFARLAARQPDLTPEEARFVVKMFVLERFLDAEFRKPDKGHLPKGARASATA